MSECGCHDTAAGLSANTDRARRRVLWIVLAINLLLFAGEFGAGWWGNSSALQADSLDSLVMRWSYGLSLWVIGGTLRQRSKAVFLKGGIQALFGVAVLVEVGRRAWFGAEPLASVMAIAAAVALVGNLVCFALLTRFRSDDMNMRSVWLCSRNDLVNNLGVIAPPASLPGSIRRGRIWSSARWWRRCSCARPPMCWPGPGATGSKAMTPSVPSLLATRCREVSDHLSSTGIRHERLRLPSRS